MTAADETFPGRSPRFLAFARWYVRRKLARGLDGVYVHGMEETRALATRHPLLLCATHVGWWDSLLCVWLDERLGTEGYAMMDRDSMRALPWFGKLGCIPVDRSGAARSRAGLRASAAVLDRPGRALWVFPQGRYRPPHLRPLDFRPGVRLVARAAGEATRIVPIAWQYVMGEGETPAAYVHLGAPLLPDAPLEAMEAAVADGLAAIDAVLAGDAAPWPAAIPPRRAAPQAGVGARLLGARGDGGTEAARG